MWTRFVFFLIIFVEFLFFFFKFKNKFSITKTEFSFSFPFSIIDINNEKQKIGHPCFFSSVVDRMWDLFLRLLLCVAYYNLFSSKTKMKIDQLIDSQSFSQSIWIRWSFKSLKLSSWLLLLLLLSLSLIYSNINNFPIVIRNFILKRIFPCCCLLLQLQIRYSTTTTTMMEK